MAFDKTWLVLIAGSGVLAVTFWGGMNAMTIKMALLWTFISFGFLTLIMHVFGSPISVMLSKLFQSAESEQSPKEFTNVELSERRKRALQKRQVLQDDKVEVYKENILKPREEVQREKQEAEFYKFSKTWKGKGYKLGHSSGEPAEHFEDYVEEEFLDEEFYANESSSSEEESDKQNSRNQEELNSATDESILTAKDHENGTQTLRQRTNNQCFELPVEPQPMEKGVITVALRCPDGTVRKRRFTVESQIRALVAFAEYLGYPSSRHVILTTYPRQPLLDLSLTLSEAGFTHDTALVIEEN